MNVQDAFYFMVRNYPGGAEALAPRMKMSPSVLRNKADTKKTCNIPSLDDADTGMALTGDYGVLHALAQNHGHVCLKVETDAPASDLAVLELVTQVWRSNGEVGRSVDDVLADHRVERRELPKIRDAIYREMQNLELLYKKIEGMAE